MSNEMILLNTNAPLNLPAHLQGQNLGVTAGILATLGAGGNRIGLKGSRFRIVVNGKEESVLEENYLDVIIVGVLPHISRMYYEGEYDQSGQTKAKPTCFSEAGDAPPADLPTKQSDKCDTCQWNVKGSKVVGNVKMKACGFFQRLVVMLANDPDRRLFKLDIKSQGIFGDSHANVNKYNIRDYGKLLGNRGIDACTVVTRVSFDIESSVPKLLFTPAAFVDPASFEAVKEAVIGEEVKNLLKITMATVDLSGEEDAPAQEEPVTPPAQQTQAPVQQAPVQTQQTAPPAPPAPAEEPKKSYRQVKEKLGAFTVQQYLDGGWTKEALIEHGMIEEIPDAPPAPPAAPPAPPKPPAPPAPPKPPAPPAPPKPPTQTVIENVPMPAQQTAKPAPAQAATTAPQEVATDAELQDLINGLL